MEQKPISFQEIFLSPKGRIGRLTYFLAFVLALTVEPPIIRILETDKNYTLIDIIFLAFLWVSASITIKRFHDLNKSTWWLLTFLVPLWNLYSLIELLFTKGMNEKNDYGEKEIPNEVFKSVGIFAIIISIISTIYVFSI